MVEKTHIQKQNAEEQESILWFKLAQAIAIGGCDIQFNSLPKPDKIQIVSSLLGKLTHGR